MEEKIQAMDEILVAQVTSCDTWRKDSAFKEEYGPRLIEWMSRGESFNSFAGQIGIPIRVLEAWVEKYESFKEAFEIGEAVSLGHWEKIAKLQSVGLIKGSATMIQYILNNRFGDKYKQKQEIGVSSEVIYQITTGINRHEGPQSLEPLQELDDACDDGLDAL